MPQLLDRSDADSLEDLPILGADTLELVKVALHVLRHPSHPQPQPTQNFVDLIVGRRAYSYKHPGTGPWNCGDAKSSSAKKQQLSVTFAVTDDLMPSQSVVPAEEGQRRPSGQAPGADDAGEGTPRTSETARRHCQRPYTLPVIQPSVLRETAEAYLDNLFAVTQAGRQIRILANIRRYAAIARDKHSADTHHP